MSGQITPSEWKLMRIIWESKEPLSLKDILNPLETEVEWSTSTVRTLLARLVNKQIVGVDKTSGHFKYYALVEKEAFQKQETKSFLDTVYEGSLKLLITAFVKDRKLSKNESKRLLEMIDELEDGIND
ncbi:MAG: BlaI/MecI/CopY family transcriptional regulator [Cellulosilyticum sp.]|nr:BlaI/MecI/CopY family transcriptional regulator [Cellulosilyticum sp.]